jgi:hypothetical protein
MGSAAVMGDGSAARGAARERRRRLLRRIVTVGEFCAWPIREPTVAWCRLLYGSRMIASN